MDLTIEETRAHELQRALGPETSLDEARRQIAAEHGFASWPNLAAYHARLELHRRTGPRYAFDGIERYTNRVASISIELTNRKAFQVQPHDLKGTGALIATFVPRFFGLNNEEIFRAEVTEAELLHAVARSERFPDWETLAEFASTHVRDRNTNRTETPLRQTLRALEQNDRTEAARLFERHPELLQPRDPRGERESILSDLAWAVVRRPSDAAMQNFEFAKSLGADFQNTLNEMLLGNIRTPPEEIQRVLDLGGDPNWKPNNGYSVLEHAAYRCWSGHSVDLIAARAVPRKSFWLSAALGDVDTMLQFIDSSGALTEEARQDRVPFDVFWMWAPNRPNASDREIIWEAFTLACMNNRDITIDALLERGFPIDYAPHELNMLRWAVGNWIPDVTETLVSRGADVHYKPWPSVSSPREMAQGWIEQSPDDAIAQRIYALVSK